MSDTSLSNLKSEWAKSIESLTNLQVEDKLGVVLEKAKNSNASDLRSRKKDTSSKESGYVAILEALEKSIPAYNAIIQNAPQKEEQIKALIEEKNDLQARISKDSGQVAIARTNLMIEILKKVVPKSYNGIRGILDDNSIPEDVKFNTVITEFENTISDCLEQVTEKDELISFNKFKINELNAKLSKQIDSTSPNQNAQIDKLNQEIEKLRKQLASNDQAGTDGPTLVLVDGEDGKKIVKSGTPKDLVDRLLDLAAFDLGYVQTFFLCHHLFIDSVELLQTLTKTMQEGMRTRFEGGDHSVLRIGNVIKFWLDNHFDDFDSNDLLLGEIDQFLKDNKASKGFNNIISTLTKILEKKLTSSNESLDDIPEKPPAAIIPKPVQTNVFLSFDPLEFARQLTLIEFDLFAAISTKEMIDQYWKLGAENYTPNVVAYEKWKAGFLSLIVSELMSYKDDKLRLQAFELMLSIGERLEELNNYSSLYLFHLAFNANPASNIKKDKSHVKILDNFSGLFSPDDNYKNLRERLANSKGPIIPPLEMYQGELIYLNSCSLLNKKEGIVQFYLLQLSSVVLLELKNYQKTPYVFTVVPIIRNFIKKSKVQEQEGRTMIKGAFSMAKGLFLKQHSRSLIDLTVDAKAAVEEEKLHNQATEAIGEIKNKLNSRIQDLQTKLSSSEAQLSVSKQESEGQKRHLTDKQTQLEESFKKEKRELLIIIKNLKAKLINRLLIPEGLALNEEPKCTKYLVKQGESTLISATLPFFVKFILTLQNTTYLSYAYGLLLHHRLFVESDILLEALIMKFKANTADASANVNAADSKGNSADAKATTEHQIKAILNSKPDVSANSEPQINDRERVASILELWLREFFKDFRDEPKVLSMLTNYVNRESMVSSDPKVNRITETLKEMLFVNPEDKAIIEPTEPISEPIIPAENFKKNFKGTFDARATPKFVLLDFDPEELARQLTLMDFSIFKQIEAREWMDNNWVTPEKLVNAPNVCKLAQLDNRIVNWIVSELVLVNDAAFRIKTMEHIISTIKHLENMNNFNGVRLLIRALTNSTAVNILLKTKKGLSESSKLYLEEVKKIFSADFGYATLRYRILISSTPLMPLMALYYSDLAFFEAIGPITSKDAETVWINVEKLVGVANTIQALKKFQKCEYHFRPVYQIQDHILKYPILSTKDAEDSAVRLEGLPSSE